jgi:hypothetical protein
MIPNPPYRAPHSNDAGTVSSEWQRFYSPLTSAVNAAPQIVTAPASAAAGGTPGQLAYDSNYLYVCTDKNTWARYAKGQW